MPWTDAERRACDVEYPRLREAGMPRAQAVARIAARLGRHPDAINRRVAQELLDYPVQRAKMLERRKRFWAMRRRQIETRDYFMELARQRREKRAL